MGLFSKKEICTICNTNESHKKLLDGHICKKCIDNIAPSIVSFSWKDITTEKARQAIIFSENNRQLAQKFQPTKKTEKYISYDENNRLWKVGYSSIIFSYDDIIDFALLEDDELITQGGVGGAIVGGALFGNVGAVVGAAAAPRKTKTEIRKLQIRITTKNTWIPTVYINLLTAGPVKSGSILYNAYTGNAQQIISDLTLIMNTNSQNQTQNPTSSADEILKYKQLYDNGIITQEEFEAKKRQLLGL